MVLVAELQSEYEEGGAWDGRVAQNTPLHTLITETIESFKTPGALIGLVPYYLK